MFDFLISIFDWLGAFAMLFLGISYVEPVTCETVPELLSIHYALEETIERTSQIDCIEFEYDADEPNRVYRI